MVAVRASPGQEKKGQNRFERGASFEKSGRKFIGGTCNLQKGVVLRGEPRSSSTEKGGKVCLFPWPRGRCQKNRGPV